VLMFWNCGEDRVDTRMGAPSMELPSGIAASGLPDSWSRGALLVARYCSQCHGIPSPARHSLADWIPTARRMFQRMEHMSRMNHMMQGRGRRRGWMMGSRECCMDVDAPTRDEQGEIVRYLQEHALRSIDPSALFDASDGAATLFTDKCSRCHALPDPTAHTPGEWPGVVERMRSHMRSMSVAEITDEEARSIVGFLERAALGGAEARGDP
jgi:mono/diheme cytochrome c family protein